MEEYISYTLYSCKEDIEIVIEDGLDQYEIAPELNEYNGKECCNWCGKSAEYSLLYLVLAEND